ncbi:MAG: hypothetical protein AAF828_08750, partial [Bacteroidota bacterium]
NGLLNDQLSLDLAGNFHFNRHEETYDISTELLIPLAKDKVALQMSWVPIERYRMDTFIRNQRVARDFDGKGWATGDIYIGTYIQLTKDHLKWPDLLLTVNLRTASGNRLTGARYTDAPGYFFDLSGGKDFKVANSFIQQIRPHAMLGFYVWQTNQEANFQNDAILFGAGIDVQLNNWQITNALAGYVGYLNNGDKPLVYRLDIRSTKSQTVNYSIGYQRGLNDYPFNRITLGARWAF